MSVDSLCLPITGIHFAFARDGQTNFSIFQENFGKFTSWKKINPKVVIYIHRGGDSNSSKVWGYRGLMTSTTAVARKLGRRSTFAKFLLKLLPQLCFSITELFREYFRNLEIEKGRRDAFF